MAAHVIITATISAERQRRSWYQFEAHEGSDVHHQDDTYRQAQPVDAGGRVGSEGHHDKERQGKHPQRQAQTQRCRDVWRPVRRTDVHPGSRAHRHECRPARQVVEPKGQYGPTVSATQPIDTRTGPAANVRNWVEAGIHPRLNPGADARERRMADTKAMTITAYLMNIALVGLVVLQIRGHKITRARLLVPVVLTVFAASQFLHAIPTAGNDIVLEALLGLLGAGLGVAAGLATNVSRLGSLSFAKAGAVAAILWVLGIGARMGFSMWVTYGGHASVARFSAAYHITSGTAWVAGFILMAMLEVAVPTGVLYT